ncbi:hypothetical protein BDV38DRAFT_265167 [Aspergillus pseudotamarii]|uniref:Uncharacterized protein n=1 Tax=Aspergillus pseudotamarii TaxID=132259 RepID=A0A5N6SBV7_ASPPS|nr:uncharacterized protein BDV38DRAFT_265167 [Aspergillus pseudotamarii]KAE8131170.1 hypothetical protein BDV38DRAFT_265167 [Aspergillus pseudotamarii]
MVTVIFLVALIYIGLRNVSVQPRYKETSLCAERTKIYGLIFIVVPWYIVHTHFDGAYIPQFPIPLTSWRRWLDATHSSSMGYQRPVEIWKGGQYPGFMRFRGI